MNEKKKGVTLWSTIFHRENGKFFIRGTCVCCFFSTSRCFGPLFREVRVVVEGEKLSCAINTRIEKGELKVIAHFEE